MYGQFSKKKKKLSTFSVHNFTSISGLLKDEEEKLRIGTSEGE
jgi:hypothetical protein